MQEGMFLQKSAVAKGTVLKERRERERERKEGSAPELEPGALGGPGGERAASSALIEVINELLAADGDGVGRNARRRAAPAKRR